MKLFRISCFALLALLACDEFNTTQDEKLKLKVSDIYRTADGTSLVLITAISSRTMVGSQTITFTTTAGELFPLSSVGQGEGKEVLDVFPAGHEVSVFLRAPRIPGNVLITATANNLTEYDTIIFRRSCASEIVRLLDDSFLHVDVPDQVNLTLELTNDTTAVSDSIKAVLTASPDTLINLPQVIYINQKKTIPITAKGPDGGTVTITIELPDCTLSRTVELKLIP